MDRQEKLEILQRLGEFQLRKNVMIPLFKKVEKFKDVRDCHGNKEFGIDIEFYEEIGIGERLYYGVQLKTKDISGTSAKRGNIKTISDQAEEAHNKGFYCVEEKKNRTIDRFLVVTTGNIAPKAEETIRDSLAKHNLEKLISFWNGERLVDFVESHDSEFFTEQATIKEVSEERDQLRAKVDLLEREIENFKLEFRMFLVRSSPQLNALEKQPSKFLCFLTGRPQCPLSPKEIRNRIFIAMPFEDYYQDMYKFGIFSAIDELNNELRLDPKLHCSKADEIPFTTDLMCKICELIQSAEYVIVDISTQNVNVMFELGLAYGMGKKVIIIMGKNTRPPSDIQGIKYFSYRRFNDIKKHIRTFFENEYRIQRDILIRGGK
ncbi:MAG: nucleotide-binding protein [Proteobacteria bacterium]|nr:nucleotide-binding protein [Pseudomonadota bacterium]